MKRHLITPPRRGAPLGDDPQWYKDAIIYEARVRSFYDSNGDGIGDFRGLATKLDYIADLGVTAIWLLPFYPSPLRDDGYDIADYTDIHPDCGTLADFDFLLAEAHRRGLRVITELVLNHTSDQHPWFKRARRAPPHSSERDFYVWNDNPERYREARIIFKDFETSNWSWDPQARAYYWHRFYAHQPDLNFESAAVHEALLGVVDFWFGKGVDGLRLDAVPYLYESDGTNCENLPETHGFIKKLRAHIDARFKDRMLLAEANQWPEDAAAYFGDGDECHMNFHFPIMPRLFMSIHMEDRFPILDILAQTPAIPDTAQWALFLRNHDELTLEMVTDEERDYMYRAYAHAAEMRINLGIRRRLAPLCGNDRRKMELLHGLLFSLPGTPVLYYGDEIGMGDNVFLGDRDGVRTPMQWSADRNAGFSRANPQRLILPINIDPEYHYEAINVEAQQNNPNSLLWWTKRLITLRKQSQAFGRGTMEILVAGNYRVLSFVRHFEDETILVVANLSRYPQYVELDLGKWKGMRPVELFGHTEFPLIGELPYLLTLGGHAFHWFSIEPPPSTAAADLAAAYQPPTITCSSAQSLIFGEDNVALEDLLPAFLDTRHWFGGRGMRVSSARIEEAVALGGAYLVVARVDYADRDPERYVIPLAVVGAAEGRAISTQAAVATLIMPGGEAVLVDAMEDPVASRAVLNAFIDRARAAGRAGVVEAIPYTPLESPPGEPANIAFLHTAAAVRYDDRYLLKMFRRLEEGISPELEIPRFLDAKAPGLAASVVGALEYRRPRGEPSTLAVLQGFVVNEGTAWAHAREELRRYFERALTRLREGPAPERAPRALLELARTETPPAAHEAIGAYLDLAALLGKHTAEMHLTLASNVDDPSFAPEPYSALDRRSKYQSMRNLVGRTTRLLRAALPQLPEHARDLAHRLADGQEKVLKIFEPFLHRRWSGLRIRTHGDYHLEQVLYTGKDFVIIDFEGPPEEPLAERRRKHECLRDVAGMIRSYHYAAFTALLESTVVRPEDRTAAEQWADSWYRWVSAAFLRAYLTTTDGASFMATAEDQPLILDTHLIRRAFFELRDELDRNVETVVIPLSALVELAQL
ncbi:MAG TPA: maltose alpha-D-glucosyltransferase [Polyangia bacterium]|nr:maltose alpha-D-glucosyltransferase [Polyangia bacterium]